MQRPNTSRFQKGEQGPERFTPAGEEGRTYREVDASTVRAVLIALVGFWWGCVAIAVAALS